MKAKASPAAKEKSSKSKTATKRNGKKWSAKVMEHSDALDLEGDIFKSGNAHEIALSLKRSAEHSKRKKGTPFQSAMSMLNFYINRAGKNLPESQKEILEKSKDELREVFGRERES